MSESNPFHSEQPKTPQEIFASLGDKFQVALDFCLEAVDQRKFDMEALVKNISKLNLQYLEHVKGLFENGVTKTLEEKKTWSTNKEIDAEKKNLSDTLNLFIERIEFFRRLKPPEKVPTGGRTADQLERAMVQVNTNISEYTSEIMHQTTTTDEYGIFTITKEAKIINFVRCKVEDLFRDKNPHTFKEILDKAQELGLELCQSEDGPNYRLHYTNQPLGEWLNIGMKQISGSDGAPHAFALNHRGNSLWLDCPLTSSDVQCYPNVELIFRLSSPN